jgi:hypothetical protein
MIIGMTLVLLIGCGKKVEQMQPSSSKRNNDIENKSISNVSNNDKLILKKEKVESNDISEWIRLINDFIYEFRLKSEVNEGDKLSITTNKEEQAVIEKMMFELEGSKTSLNYIFDGNITYIEE